MSESDDLLRRLADLERRVHVLESGRAPGRPSRWFVRVPLGMRWAEARSEDVLGKAGVALLLVGVLFLLKWTVDQGLLTAAVRVGGVGVLGAALLAFGQRMRRSRPVLGRLLAGAGVAALYGALWTAGVLYPLLPSAVAFAGLAAVAALALGLSLREEDAALAVVATLGGLFTPLLLYREPGQIGILAAYAVLVLGGAAFVFERKRWPMLLGAAALGGWGVVIVAWLVEIDPPTATSASRAAFSVLVLATWAVTGLLPLLRPSRSSPTRWPSLVRPELLAPALGPIAALGALGGAWSVSRPLAAALALGAAAVYAALARSRRPEPIVYVPLVFGAAALVVWASARLFDGGDPRVIAVALAAGSAVVLLGRRDGLADLARVGHAVALGAAVWLGFALWFGGGLPWEETQALARGPLARLLGAALVGAIALGAVGFSTDRGSGARAVYLTGAHLLVLLAVRLALRPTPEGAAWTSAVWGTYGIVLVVVGLRLRDPLVRQIGLGTVLATALKVLLLDLPDIPAVWRVVLFMGLGALLLLVSYLVPGLLGRDPDPETPQPGGDGSIPAEPPEVRVPSQ